MSKNKSPKRRKVQNESRRRSILLIAIAVAVVVIVVVSAGALLYSHTTSTPSTTAVTTNKKIILYVNQGNALVDQSNFSSLLSFAKSDGFNTLFFQVYRSGELLFTQTELNYFVFVAHQQNFSIFFALYFTDTAQQIPVSIYGDGENGISLDMSLLPSSSQADLLQTLKQNYHEGKTAVTTTNMTCTLDPDLLILETYTPSDQAYIRSGIIAAVEPLALGSKLEYESQFDYALAHSDGVMVFDYYGLLKTGY
jgi:hypothetical protein